MCNFIDNVGIRHIKQVYDPVRFAGSQKCEHGSVFVIAGYIGIAVQETVQFSSTVLQFGT